MRLVERRQRELLDMHYGERAGGYQRKRNIRIRSAMRNYFKICSECGAHLDAGEACTDCKEKEEANVQKETA